MEMVFTKEKVIKAKDDAETRAKLVSQSQMLLVMLYMGAANDKSEEGESEPEGVVCSRCSELTLYSSADLLPGADFPMMCLSVKCIEDAIVELASKFAGEAAPPTE